jgi:hypothetical protein
MQLGFSENPKEHLSLPLGTWRANKCTGSPRDKNHLSLKKSQVTIVFMPNKLGIKAVNPFTHIGKN